MTEEDPELQFVAGKLSADIPKIDNYLLKYFKTRIQRAFLEYYLLYGNFSKFTEHTGHKCSIRSLFGLRRKLEKIQAAHEAARKNFDLDTLGKIEDGKYDWTSG